MPTARGYELACWLAAALLALALALAPAPNTGVAAPLNSPSAAPPAPSLVLYQQHCIERILTRAVGKTEESVVAEINQLCTAPRRATVSAAAGPILLSCERPFTVRFTLVATRVGGCLGD